MIINRRFLQISFFTLLNCLIIYYSQSLFDFKLPDSNSYLSFSPKYKSLYPFSIKIIDALNFNLIYVQIFVLSFSIIFLCEAVSKKKNLLISLILYFSIIINFFYTSFSKTILTESFFLSLINVGVGLFILNSNKKLNYYFYCIVLGLIFSIKSIGFIIVFSFLFLNYLRKDKFNYLGCLLIILLFVVLENILFYQKNNTRQNVLTEVILGKTFFLSGKPSFKIEDYPDTYKVILEKSKNYFSDVQSSLSRIENFPTKVELQSDYEVVAQFQFYNELNTEEKKIYLEMSKNKYLVFSYLLQNNFKDYFNLSINHYFGQWVAGFKQEYLEKNYLPKFEQLVLSSGGINFKNYSIIKIGRNLLIILFIFFQIISIASFIKFIFNKKTDSLYLMICSQIYLVVVSFVNISTIRYLMPIYPMIILSCLIFINEMVKKKNVLSARY